MAVTANSWTGSSGLRMLSPALLGESYWWNCGGISSVHAQGNLELQASLPPGPASLRRHWGFVRNPSFPNFKLPLHLQLPLAGQARRGGASPQHVYTTQ